MGKKIYNLVFEQPTGSSLGAQLKEVIDFLNFLQSHPDEKEFVISLSDIRFVHPLFVLAIASLKDYLNEKGFKIYFQFPFWRNCKSYMKNIYFPIGLKPDEIDNWDELLNKYRKKNHLPIINFSTERGNVQTFIREKVLSKINTLVKNNLNLDNNYESAFSYLISEITDNIIEHSGVNRGWLLIQYYPTTEYLDLCIIDNGKTILGSYKDHDFEKITTHEEALKAAIEGISTKSIERGTGIRTSKAISSLGLNGDFTIFSGSSIYYENKIINLETNWPGTFVAMRIKKGVQNFSLYNYV